MLAYWLMFLAPAAAVFQREHTKRGQAWMAWVAVGAVFSVLMGFRDRVGGDWFNYLPMFLNTGAMTFTEALSSGDPGYSMLNWVVHRLGGSMYGVNLFCAAVLIWGTVVFCRRQPNPWLALLVAVPYMLIVVGMGYTRQGVALGFALLGLTALGNGQVRKFVIWIAIGALFHKSAVLLMPIAALAASRNRMLTIGLVLLTTAMAYYLLLQDSAEDLWASYVVSDMQSQGGMIRVAMNTLPALILFAFGRRLEPDDAQRKLWLWISAFALACVPLVSLASTAVDRVALYLIPLQMFVFVRLPRLATAKQIRTILVLSVMMYYAVVQYVWLNYATHAKYWVPYQFVPLT